VCDTLFVLGKRSSVFAKSSDRPPGEVQLVRAHPRRPAGGILRAQYIEIEDTGAAATLLARPTWLWGAEHGVNEHRVAAGNEKLYTVSHPAAAPDGLIGMDLLRLALERSRSAEEAVEVITCLLSRYGQGGLADAAHNEAYDSSFLVSDPREAWVIETSGRSWAAKQLAGSGAVSNRISLRTDWVRGSADLAPGDDFDRYRDPDQLTTDADMRLAASRSFLAGQPDDGLSAGAVVAHLRDHGSGPWGAPGAGDMPEEPPAELRPDFTGISLCLHVRGYMVTTSSMVAELPADPGEPLRAWVALGSPCATVFVPVFPPDGDHPGAVPDVLGSEETWLRFDRVRQWLEDDPSAIGDVRAVLDPIEAELWEEADDVAAAPDRWEPAVREWSRRVAQAAASLTREHPGVSTQA